jgi:hypothetical protein
MDVAEPHFVEGRRAARGRRLDHDRLDDVRIVPDLNDATFLEVTSPDHVASIP